MIEFKKLEFEDYDLVKKYFNLYPQISCDYNLSNLYTWGNHYTIKYAIIKDRLFFINPAYCLVFFPIGKYFEPEELREVYEDIVNSCPKSELILVPKDYLNRYPDFGNYFNIVESNEWSDYVYTSEKLFLMPGKKLAKKKNLISQFQRLYENHTIERIHKYDKDAIMEFCKLWKENKSESDIELEFMAIERTFDFWDEIESKGLMLKIEGKIVAFTIFSPQNQTMLTEHFEKFDYTVKGAAQMIVWELSKYALTNNYRFINREQDMNIEGLRQAKRSYDPEFQIEFYRSPVSQDSTIFALAK